MRFIYQKKRDNVLPTAGAAPSSSTTTTTRCRRAPPAAAPAPAVVLGDDDDDDAGGAGPSQPAASAAASPRDSPRTIDAASSSALAGRAPRRGVDTARLCQQGHQPRPVPRALQNPDPGGRRDAPAGARRESAGTRRGEATDLRGAERAAARPLQAGAMAKAFSHVKFATTRAKPAAGTHCRRRKSCRRCSRPCASTSETCRHSTPSRRRACERAPRNDSCSRRRAKRRSAQRVASTMANWADESSVRTPEGC